MKCHPGKVPILDAARNPDYTSGVSWQRIAYEVARHLRQQSSSAKTELIAAAHASPAKLPAYYLTRYRHRRRAQQQLYGFPLRRASCEILHLQARFSPSQQVFPASNLSFTWSICPWAVKKGEARTVEMTSRDKRRMVGCSPTANEQPCFRNAT